MHPKTLPALTLALQRGYKKGHVEAHAVREAPSFEEVMEWVVKHQLYAIREWFYMGETDEQNIKIGGTD